MRRLEVRFGEMYGKVCWKEDWYILSRGDNNWWCSYCLNVEFGNGSYV